MSLCVVREATIGCKPREAQIRDANELNHVE